MKATLMTMVFLLGSINAFALPPKNAPNNFKLSEEKCNEIAWRDKKIFDEQSGFTMLETDAPKTTILYYQNAGMVTYQRMSKVCSTKKDNATLADLMIEQSSCSDRCDDTKSFFNDKGSQDRAKQAKSACKSICDMSALRLKAIGEGIGMALKEMPAGDCTGVVADKGRGIDVKSISMEEDPGNAIAKQFAKEAAKKASGK